MRQKGLRMANNSDESHPSNPSNPSAPSDPSDPSDPSAPSDPSDKSDPYHKPHTRLIFPHGGYRKLRSFQTAQLVYDGTVVFCQHFVSRNSRTHDQVVQAARSGVQNIAEGSLASATSKKTELKLTGIARASLEELLLDYQDYLRQRRLRLWQKDDPPALAVRRKFASGNSNEADWPEDPEVFANTMICLINQASYLLHRQLERLEIDFLEKGGFTERLYHERRRAKKHSDPSDPSDRSD